MCVLSTTSIPASAAVVFDVCALHDVPSLVASVVPLVPTAHRWVESRASTPLSCCVPTSCEDQLAPLNVSIVPLWPTANTCVASTATTAVRFFVVFDVC